MKRLLGILAIVSMLLFSCVEKQPESVVVEPTPLPFTISDTLLQIDTLLQNRPDSALMLLIEPSSFRAQRGISYTFNESYRNLLLSEALYKTYNTQYYRDDLQAAMRFFDSLAAQYPGNDDVAFYAARSHYMNGVSYYETDSVVAACREYLHALEIMEDHFVETHGRTSLQGYKAKFMGLTYGRLKELFFSHFMVEPAIYCGKKALYFCRISPTSKYGISNNLAKLGQLYDMLDMTDTAYYYYNEAITSLPDTNNLIYRDLVSSIYLLNYKSGYGLQPSLKRIHDVAIQAESEGELLARYYTIGGLYYEEQIYDSASVYLDMVFEHDDNLMRRLQSAAYLKNICKISNDTLKAEKYIVFLADHTVSKYENSFNVSTLDEMFQNYLNIKTRELQKRRQTRIMRFAIPIIVLCVLCFATISRYKSKKLKKLTKEHRKIIDTERKAHYREKNKMLDTIKQHETKVSALEQELGQKRIESDVRMEAFLNEPVCIKIRDSVDSINISSRANYADYTYLKLDDTTISDLYKAVNKHFPNFKQRILLLTSKLDNKEMLICQLYLIGLKEQQICVLMQCHYSTIFRKIQKLESHLDDGVTLSEFVQKTAVS